jgi:putative phosphoserine phosphatase/1-acylglycerol-3-phosphate O-acyltransferase
MVTMMPEGTIPRGPAFFRKPTGRWGAARLAQMTGAPVIPVGLWGTDQVWPRSSRLPNVLNVTAPPTVRIRVGEPVRLVGRSMEADTRRIMNAIVDLLPDDAYRRPKPTAEELAATYPPGYSGDPARESTRRPGTD